MARCQQAGEDVYETFKPGGRLHPTYFLEHKGHLVVEAVFLLVIAYLTLHPRAPHRSRKQETPLTEQARSQRVSAAPTGAARKCRSAARLSQGCRSGTGSRIVYFHDHERTS